MRHYLHDPTFSHFDTIPECDRQTHSETHDDGIYRASIASRGKNYTSSTVDFQIRKVLLADWVQRAES